MMMKKINTNFKRYWIYFVSFIVLVFISCSSGGDESSGSNIDTIPPTVPTNLNASEITVTTIKLMWTASTDNMGIRDYSVYNGNTLIASEQTTSYYVAGLTNNTNYSFKVKASDNAGNMSGFSDVLSVSTLDENPELQIASGDIEAYMGNIIDNVLGSSGDNYKVPTSTQLNTWNLVIDAILTENISEAVSKSSEINYQITKFTDTSLTPNQIFYILEERSNQSNYWGTFVFSKTPTRENLILTAPHIKYDTNTGYEAVYCFKNNLTKAVFINGTHRCNSNSYSTCSGTTSACGTSESYRISDMAHNTNSIFQKTTEILFSNISNSVFIQLHGFAKQASDPYVIMSNGTRETPTTDYAVLIRDALLVEDNSLTFKLAHIDTDWTRLIGFTNTQGRLINNSPDFCNTSATTTSGRFIHIEQEKSKLRDDAIGWAKMSNALKNVFN